MALSNVTTFLRVNSNGSAKSNFLYINQDRQILSFHVDSLTNDYTHVDAWFKVIPISPPVT